MADPIDVAMPVHVDEHLRSAAQVADVLGRDEAVLVSCGLKELAYHRPGMPNVWKRSMVLARCLCCLATSRPVVVPLGSA